MNGEESRTETPEGGVLVGFLLQRSHAQLSIYLSRLASLGFCLLAYFTMGPSSVMQSKISFVRDSKVATRVSEDRTLSNGGQ